MEGTGLGGLLQWAQAGRDQFPGAGQFPIKGGLETGQVPFWDQGQLNINGGASGYQDLLNVGIGGGQGTPGSGGGGFPGGTPGSAGGLNNGMLNANWYYNRYPAVLSAYNSLTPEDREYLEGSGYNPSYSGFAQYHYDTYGNWTPDWALQGLGQAPG